MKLKFKKSNKRYKWSTEFVQVYSHNYKVTLQNLKELYPTAIIEHRIKNKCFRKYKTLITFTEIADEADFIMRSNGGLEI